MSVVRLGFIGASRALQLARACQQVDDIEASVFFDVDAEAAHRAANEVGASTTPTLEALLDSNVDAVVVGSPIPFHLEHVRAAYAAGKHVLCEVTPCSTMDEARAMVEVVQASGLVFMLAENYSYFSEVETVRRLHADGRFGDVYYAECDHLIDIRALWRDQSGALTWRGRGEVGVYSTHGLGPLLTILDDRVVSISAETVSGGQFDPQVTFPTMHLMQMTTERGRKMRLRIDLASPRPPLGAFYAIQGTHGAYESWRGLGDEPKIWLEDTHGPNSIRKWADWHPLDAFRQEYLGDAWEPVPGLAGCDRRMMIDFAAAVRGERANPIDIHRAMDFYLPGLLADDSAVAGGVPIEVPDTRRWPG
ncbi:MAG: Gfo/Idh/MocA family oxidoreductase [Thermomicrobiales bacterium]|jgi:predicted dehydrogenase|nr:Gfo/Idh/MocA family oxidoreductase [Thermomicrobiales bacterium]